MIAIAAGILTYDLYLGWQLGLSYQKRLAEGATEPVLGSACALARVRWGWLCWRGSNHFGVGIIVVPSGMA